MPRGDNIPTYTPPPTNTGSGGGGSSSDTPGTGSGSGSGSGGGGYDPYAYAKAAERKADREANRRYLAQVETLQQQVEALKKALGPNGFKAALDQKLANVRLATRQSDRDLLRGYRDRVGSLRGAAEDNEKSAESQSVANLNNRARERMGSMAEAFAAGAGESDLLRAQEASLRNWQANQSEITRSYHDTLRSVNSSLTDLTVDTRTARINNVMQANADKEQLWSSYYGQRSEALTQLGNVKGLQAEYLGMANEAVGSKKTRRRQKAAANASGDFFMGATNASSQAWESPGVSKRLRQWDGAEQFEGQMNQDPVGSALTTIPVAKPEGATLRKW